MKEAKMSQNKAPLTTLSSQESVKQKGNCRRRTESGHLSGVLISEIRTHLMKNVPGLIDHGISKSTVRRLFQPPNRGHSAASKYKSVIDARVGTKSNNFRRYHPDNHYFYCRKKQRREFCTLFKSDACILSMDGMAKIKVGAPVVSRYHQIRRLFPTNDSPNFEDHDFRVPNYLLSVPGYINLVMNPREEILEEENREANKSESQSFWTVASKECKKHFNINASAEEIISYAQSEIDLHNSFYERKFDLTKEGISIEATITSQVQLEIASTALASIFECKVVLENAANHASRVYRGRSEINNFPMLKLKVPYIDSQINVSQVDMEKEIVKEVAGMI